MKCRRLLVLGIAVTVVFTMSACSSGTAQSVIERIESAAEERDTEGSADSSGKVSNGGIVIESESGTDTSGSDGGVMTTAAEYADDMFTNRDTDYSYDESEAASIKLSDSGSTSDSSSVVIDGSTITITGEGVYVLSGSLSGGQIVVDVEDTEKVQLVLNGVSVTNDSSAAIYIKQADKVFITLADGTENYLSTTGDYAAIDDNNIDGVIYSKETLTINGGGKLTIDGSYNGIVSKDNLKVTGGTIVINAANHGMEGKDSVRICGGDITITSGEDGIHSDNEDDSEKGYIYISGGSITIDAGDDGIHAVTMLTIDGGTMDITAAEGLEATCITVNDGTIDITASDDGINAAAKSSAYTPVIEVNGGTITVVMGQGDTDGLDSNGYIYINGGYIDITCNSPFDYDMGAEYNGGTLIVNGEETTEITNQFGGMGGFGGRGGMTDFGQQGGELPDFDRELPDFDREMPDFDGELPDGMQGGFGRHGDGDQMGGFGGAPQLQ